MDPLPSPQKPIGDTFLALKDISSGKEKKRYTVQRKNPWGKHMASSVWH